MNGNYDVNLAEIICMQTSKMQSNKIKIDFGKDNSYPKSL